MKSLLGYIIGGIIGIVLCLVSMAWFKAIQAEAERQQQETSLPSVVWRQNHYILTPENLYNELVAQGVAFPDIVLTQALLETSYFKSNACTDRNNLFGLRCYNGTYMKFDHWTDCVAAYKCCIQDWDNPPEDYFNYLDSLGYAEDPGYITKLKQMMK